MTWLGTVSEGSLLGMILTKSQPQDSMSNKEALLSCVNCQIGRCKVCHGKIYENLGDAEVRQRPRLINIELKRNKISTFTQLRKGSLPSRLQIAQIRLLSNVTADFSSTPPRTS